jgi:hypothetical protein
MITIPLPNEDVSHLIDVIFPAILLELGPPPPAYTPQSPPGTARRPRGPLRGLGGGLLRSSTSVGSKSQPSAPAYPPSPPAAAIASAYWTYREHVTGLLRYRFNVEMPSVRADDFMNWCYSQQERP